TSWRREEAHTPAERGSGDVELGEGAGFGEDCWLPVANGFDAEAEGPQTRAEPLFGRVGGSEGHGAIGEGGDLDDGDRIDDLAVAADLQDQGDGVNRRAGIGDIGGDEG